MDISIKKIDLVNTEIDGTIKKDEFDKKVKNIINKLSKTVDIAGFRKGKVPPKIIQERYQKQAEQEAMQELVDEVTKNGIKQAEVDENNLATQPMLKEKDVTSSGDIKVLIIVSTNPKLEVKEYTKIVPTVKIESVTKTSIDKRIKEVTSSFAELKSLKTKRALKNGDHAIIDFEGFLDGEPFDGGSAKDHTLLIGSNSFIGTFEEQLVGMNIKDEKEIKVTFPTDYQVETLSGKEATFKVKLNDIQIKGKVELNEELIKKIIPQEEEHTLEVLQKNIKKELSIMNRNKAYTNEIKKETVDALVKSYEFDIPLTLLENEVGMSINEEAKNMSQEEVDKLLADPKLLDELREKYTPESTDRIKAAYILGALAKKLEINISQDEIYRVLYYEALQLQKDPRELIKEYTDSGAINSVRVAMMEDKTLMRILDEVNGVNFDD